MLIEMNIAGITIDPITNTPIVILKDKEERKALPIWIGIFEASAIASQLEKITYARPMTHDLLYEVLKTTEVVVEKIEINDLRNNTFFANIYLSREGASFVVDARPSDAIALALRAEAPIFVDEAVIEKSRTVDFGEKSEDMEKLKEEKLKELLESLSPEDFGKYKM
ncbi:MAG TPA: bifunctional nuclease family protein [Syntrophales bacterium]|nr:bifunctional nuclease family protein [Syntrophales bacterium]HOM07346.1 bifunctional nuclease family protein [Syntrophales bacterium]HON98949.1 bifunctional nuclease family protein [Syntrophales bacterium]HPC00413.1 bifunctional nuclease family protein [Syntrophales bacterium]HPQ07016.1 bifunctional nuclease family protein [Syntrophales bacterium]